MKLGTKPNVDYHKEEFLAVDPGSAGTGLAYFGIEKIPKWTKIIQYDNNASWERKCDYICNQFKYLIFQNERIRAVYCEQPQYMQTFKGQTSATSGSLFKLCTLYGRFWEITYTRGIKFFPVEIPKWKGQLDKKKVKIRVDRIIPNNNYVSHAIDAVGIGLFTKGLL